ncbi:hypothetical protein GCM10017711_06990 [Paeniglutamicibacter sulfureus]
MGHTHAIEITLPIQGRGQELGESAMVIYHHDSGSLPGRGALFGCHWQYSSPHERDPPKAA